MPYRFSLVFYRSYGYRHKSECTLGLSPESAALILSAEGQETPILGCLIPVGYFNLTGRYGFHLDIRDSTLFAYPGDNSGNLRIAIRFFTLSQSEN
jgi:hypothetical protein